MTPALQGRARKMYSSLLERCSVGVPDWHTALLQGHSLLPFHAPPSPKLGSSPSFSGRGKRVEKAPPPLYHPGPCARHRCAHAPLVRTSHVATPAVRAAGKCPSLSGQPRRLPALVEGMQMFGGESADSALASSHSILEMRKLGCRGVQSLIQSPIVAQNQPQEARQGRWAFPQAGGDGHWPLALLVSDTCGTGARRGTPAPGSDHVALLWPPGRWPAPCSGPALTCPLLCRCPC